MNEQEQDRYISALAALTECIVKGVSDAVVKQLAIRCKISDADFAIISKFKVTA